MRFAALILLFAAASRGQQSCPWLNAATAAGVLGGDVKSQITEDSCLFAHGSSELRIEVKTVNLPYKPDCSPNPTALRAIGNEAVACEKPGSDQVAGRVRDRAFFVRLTSNDFSRIALREKVHSVAEQVAGILF